MAHAIKRLEGWLDAISDNVAILSVIALVILTVLVTFSVVMRYVFNSALTWSDEIAAYCLVAIVFFGLSHTLIKGGHICIDVLTNLMSENVRNWFMVLSYSVGIAFSVFLVFSVEHRFAEFLKRGSTSFTVLQTPLFIPAIPLLIGAVMLLLTMILKLASLIIDMAELDSPRGRSRRRRR